MTIKFKWQRAFSKKSRYPRKFPRQKFKNPNTTIKDLKLFGYCRHNWIDGNYEYIHGNMYRFLKSMLGKSIDKVYSKLVKRLDKYSKAHISSKKFLSNYLNNPHYKAYFYVENDILKYSPINRPKRKKSNFNLNKEHLESTDFSEIIKKVLTLNIPQYIGDFYLKENISIKTPVYLDNRPLERVYNSKYVDVCLGGYWGILIDRKTLEYNLVKNNLYTETLQFIRII